MSSMIPKIQGVSWGPYHPVLVQDTDHKPIYKKKNKKVRITLYQN